MLIISNKMGFMNFRSYSYVEAYGHRIQTGMRLSSRPLCNKGTWRDIESASIIFARGLGLLLTGDSAGGFPSAFGLNDPACARSIKPREVSVRPTKVCAALA